MSKQKAPRAKHTIETSQEAYENFCAAWNSADTKGEVAEKTKLSPAKVAQWSYRLRKAGVPLKKFTTKVSSLDIKKLTEIAKKAMKG